MIGDKETNKEKGKEINNKENNEETNEENNNKEMGGSGLILRNLPKANLCFLFMTTGMLAFASTHPGDWDSRPPRWLRSRQAPSL